ncbi:MAG TPA: sulfotransferase [Steroidobacteraceae bacterium]|nr:sulfotransferase [Steroidobacteraceae bacterium]
MNPAVARDAKADHATLSAVHAAARRGAHAEAASMAQTALADGLEHPLLLNVCALNLELQGRVTDAEQLLQRAVAMAPGDLSSRNALGLCLLRLEQPDQALAQFDAMIALDPTLPFAHASRGNALAAVGAINDAEASYQRALDLDANQGVALAGLARIAASRGAHREARERAQKALDVLPGFPDAVMSLAAAELGERQVNRAELRLRALLTDTRLSPVERAYTTGLLGDVLDAKSLPDEAFTAYASCNEQLQRIYAQRFSASPGALEYARALTHYFERLPPRPGSAAEPRLTGAAAPSDHVFLLGFPRSGTTLLEVVLEGHPDVVSLEENELLIDAVREFMRGPADLDRLMLAPEASLEPLRAAYWRLVAAAGVNTDGKVFIDKHPLNTLKLPLIARLFPRAKILFACRDPRDVVLSCFRHRFQMSAPIYELLSLEGAARYYDAVMMLAVCLTTALKLNMCLVRHEDVVTEFTREMKRVCSYLNLEWVAAMGDFALRTQKRAVLTPSTAQLVRGLNTEGLGQWRRYQAELLPVLPILEPWVKRFFYDP